MTLAGRSQDKHFLTVTLPLVLSGSGLLLYLVTLNHWLSLHSLMIIARVSGWLWQPQVGRPLTTLVLYPFHWLPEPWIPLALNLLHAACAAIVLALLARSVALLRYDVPPPKGSGKDKKAAVLLAPNAWMPPVVAVVLCALQLSFWEHATVASAEMIDLVIFAYLLKCLLEFRIDSSQVWLSRAAVAYGAGMANNWIMVGYFPLFILALILLKKLRRFLDRRFLLRMSFCGLAGLSLYLLLPALDHFTSDGQLGFWSALKGHLKFQKEALEIWRRPTLRVLGLSSILPFILIAIPWKSHSIQRADDSRFGVFIAKATGHLVHAVFLAASLWVAFDAAFTPRTVVPALPMLTFYYMSALAGGYCCGYFLIFHLRNSRNWSGKLALRGSRVLLVTVPLLLLVRNIGSISTTNGPLLREFAKQIYADLPGGKSVLLADEWSVGVLLLAERSSQHGGKQPIILDPAAISMPRYERFVAEKFTARWPIPLPANRLDTARPGRLLRLVSAFQAQQAVFFLGPPFGPLFEHFADQPHGFVHLLQPRAAQDAASPVLAGPVLAANEQLWEERWNGNLKNLSRKVVGRSDQGAIWLRHHRNNTAGFVAANCSKSLDGWGVQMRRGGQGAEAMTWFQRAMEINPNNVAARINLEYAQRCQNGDKRRLNAVALRQEIPVLEQGQNWGQVLVRDGPVDEPTFLFRTGRFMLASGQSRQAAGAFARSLELAPDWIAPKIWLAESCLNLQNFDSALQLAEGVQAAGAPADGIEAAHLLHCRGMALIGLGRTNDAMAAAGAALGRYPEQREVLGTAADLYAAGGQFDLELGVIEELLKREPERVELLTKRGVAELHASKYERAIATLTKALSLAPADGEVRLSRAVAYIGADQLDAARSEYQTLLRDARTSTDALFGLGTVAWREQNTNAAIRYYREYVANAPPKSPQYKMASARLAALKH